MAQSNSRGKNYYANKKKKLKKRAKEHAAGLRSDSNLDADTLGYFERALAHLEAGEFQDSEERGLFVSNVLNEISGREVQFATDAFGCVVLDRLIVAAPEPATLLSLLAAFAGHASDLVFDRFGYRILEVLVARVGASLHEASDEAQRGDMVAAVSGVARDMRAHWMDALVDPYASHVARSLVSVLAGFLHVLRRFQPSGRMGRGAGLASVQPSRAPMAPPSGWTHELNALIRVMADAAPSWDVFSGLVYHTTASRVIQLAVHVAPVKTVAWCVGRLDITASTECYTDEMRQSFIEMMNDPIASHFLEQLMPALPADLLHAMYDGVYASRLRKFSARHPANHVVQAMLAALSDPGRVAAAVAEVEPRVTDILAAPGVLVRLCDACIRTDTGFQPLLRGLAAALGVALDDADALLPSLLDPSQGHGSGDDAVDGDVDDMTLADASNDDDGTEAGGDAGGAVSQAKSRFWLFGAWIAQRIWRFPADACAPFADSLAALSQEHLVQLACDPAGSWVFADAFSSTAVSSAIKARLMRRLNGVWATIAMDRYGSRAIESAFASSDMHRKQAMASELAASELVPNHFYGQFVWRKLRLDSYNAGAETWKAAEAGRARKRDMFADILGAKRSPAAGAVDAAAATPARSEQEARRLLETAERANPALARAARALRGADAGDGDDGDGGDDGRSKAATALQRSADGNSALDFVLGAIEASKDGAEPGVAGYDSSGDEAGKRQRRSKSKAKKRKKAAEAAEAAEAPGHKRQRSD